MALLSVVRRAARAAGAHGRARAQLALDVKVILTPPCIFH
jgi:hypothetical protein